MKKINSISTFLILTLSFASSQATYAMERDSAQPGSSKGTPIVFNNLELHDKSKDTSHSIRLDPQTYEVDLTSICKPQTFRMFFGPSQEGENPSDATLTMRIVPCSSVPELNILFNTGKAVVLWQIESWKNRKDLFQYNLINDFKSLATSNLCELAQRALPSMRLMSEIMKFRQGRQNRKQAAYRKYTREFLLAGVKGVTRENAEASDNFQVYLHTTISNSSAGESALVELREKANKMAQHPVLRHQVHAAKNIINALSHIFSDRLQTINSKEGSTQVILDGLEFRQKN